MKNLKDYLHLYLGCRVMVGDEVLNLLSVGVGGYTASDGNTRCQGTFEYRGIKLILRRLSSMTEEEKIMLCALNMPNGWQPGHIIETNDDDIAAMRIFDMKGEYKTLYIPKNRISSNNFLWLLKKGFDLFNLIDEGLAIDATTLETKN